MKSYAKINKIFILIVALSALYVVIRLEMSYLDKNGIMKEKYNEVKNNYEAMRKNIAFNKYYYDMEKFLEDKKTKLIIYNVDQEDIIDVLNKHINSCNLNITKFKFETMQEILTEKNNNIGVSSIFMMSINIEFSSDYDEMLEFIYLVQNNPLDMAITDIWSTYDGENVYVTMDLKFCSLEEI